MDTSDRRLLERISERLAEEGLSISVAESCTGGMLGMLLTSVPGSSRWFLGGVVAYSNGLKESLLGVPLGLIQDNGAVSRGVADEMARGAVRLTGSDISLAVTGIAGPEGGTADKPVGTVWMALRTASGTATWKEVFTGDRDGVRRQASRYILERLRQYLEGERS